jgi:hypothetical protein
LELLDGAALLNRWAEIVAANGEAGPRKVEAAAAEGVGYDVLWEKAESAATSQAMGTGASRKEGSAGGK